MKHRFATTKAAFRGMIRFTAIILSASTTFTAVVHGCQLFAASYSQPLHPGPYFQMYRAGGIQNPDGWGVAVYDQGAALVIKQPESAWESDLSAFLGKSAVLKTELLVAHVRRGSVGSQALRNTHPYKRERDGRDWTLAHNCTLRDFRDELPPGDYKPVGRTDSEYIFCHLLHRLKDENLSTWSDEEVRLLRDLLREINAYGTMNILLSDGEHLFAYRDANGYTGLSYLEQQHPLQNSIETAAESEAKAFDTTKDYTLPEDAQGVIIATYPLTTESWKEIPHGELIVARKGNIIFHSTAKD